MSHKIPMGKAKLMYARSMELQQMQKDGMSIPKSRRRNKVAVAKKKQTSFIQRIKNRIIANKGKMPKSMKEENGI